MASQFLDFYTSPHTSTLHSCGYILTLLLPGTVPQLKPETPLIISFFPLNSLNPTKPLKPQRRSSRLLSPNVSSFSATISLRSHDLSTCTQPILSTPFFPVLLPYLPSKSPQPWIIPIMCLLCSYSQVTKNCWEQKKSRNQINECC